MPANGQVWRMRREEATAMNEYAANIMACYQQATKEDKQAGKDWYPTYAAWIAAYGEKHGLNRAQSIAVFAIISQQTGIRENTRMFKAVAASHNPDAADRQNGKVKAKIALALQDRDNPGQWAKGPKISAFYQALSGDGNAVPLDRHARSLACGEVLGDKAKKLPVADEQAIHDAYITVARMLAIPPRDLQAITWCTWRRINAVLKQWGDNIGDLDAD